MELFYDLLHMKPFSEAFVNQLMNINSNDLFESYMYLFRFTPQNFQSFPFRREILFFKFFSNLFLQSKTDLINKLHIFDDFLRILIDLIDSSPCDEMLNRSTRSISSSTLLLTDIRYCSYELKIDYENQFHFHLCVLDCDTIDQIKRKIINYLNSYENTNRLIEFDEIDLLNLSANQCLCQEQIPMLRNSFNIHSTIYCQKNISVTKEKKKNYLYHLCKENQLIFNENLIHEQLKENKNRLEQILIYFYQQIANGLDLFLMFNSQFIQENNQISFQQLVYYFVFAF